MNESSQTKLPFNLREFEMNFLLVHVSSALEVSQVIEDFSIIKNQSIEWKKISQKNYLPQPFKLEENDAIYYVFKKSLDRSYQHLTDKFIICVAAPIYR